MEKNQFPQNGSSNRAGVVVVVVAGGLLYSSLGLDVALRSAGGPGACSVDVCSGVQAMCFVRAQALKPRSASDIAPSLNQESASD